MTKLLAVVIMALVIIGCGPKMAKKETMNALAEARSALESAQTMVTELEVEKSTLESQKMELTRQIEKMGGEITALQNKIDTRCKKTGRIK